MNAVRSEAWAKPSGADTKLSPFGGSPRRARTLSTPAAASWSRIAAISERECPVQLRWAIGLSPISFLIRATRSITWPRFEPIAP